MIYLHIIKIVFLRRRVSTRDYVYILQATLSQSRDKKVISNIIIPFQFQQESLTLYYNEIYKIITYHESLLMKCRVLLILGKTRIRNSGTASQSE